MTPGDSAGWTLTPGTPRWGCAVAEVNIHLENKKTGREIIPSGFFIMVRLTGIEPVHPAPEAGALSPELQAQTYYAIKL